jgi:hypothetical protein
VIYAEKWVKGRSSLSGGLGGETHHRHPCEAENVQAKTA